MGLQCPKLQRKNGILLPKLFWPTVRKNCSSYQEKFWNSRLKAENLQTFWDHYNNLFKQWKVRTMFGNRMLFKVVPCWRFSDLINYSNSDWKKMLEFRNLLEKLEKEIIINFVEMSKIQNTNTSIKFLGIHGLRIIKNHLLFVALVMLGMQTIWQQISQIKWHVKWGYLLADPS